jgi:amino acid transporter
MFEKTRAFLFGPPKDVHDRHTFRSVSLIAMLAWVGLGADGLSSTAYGPDAAFRQLTIDPLTGRYSQDFTSLAVGLAIGTALTVFIISYAYSRIIEHFPSGGGGYVVATKLLGPRFGVVSGSALLVDYVLTIATSFAAGGDALFNMVPREWFGSAALRLAESDLGTWADPVQRFKVGVELATTLTLIVLNIRGVRVTAILPILAVFILTHAIVLLVAVGGHAGDLGTVAHATSTNYAHTVATLGAVGTLALFVRAYSLGGGTYTGIEAVSNGVGVMREPKVRTAKRTMVLMATSLATMAGGIILAYLLVHAVPAPGKTMNAVLFERVTHAWHLGGWRAGETFTFVALVSEAGLLFIAAQAGFVDGPRVMSNMAVDSWMPHRFAALSERLSMQNGVLIMGAGSVAALLYTHGDVSRLVVMYSINVFLTFSLSNLGMSRFWMGHRKEHPDWYRHLPVHLTGLTLCVTILVVTCFEKFGEGGWLTLVITGALVGACFAIKQHYRMVAEAIERLDVELPDPLLEIPEDKVPKLTVDPRQPVAILFVGRYGGLGRHALMTMLRMFPGHFKGVVFCSIAIIDSGNFKGVDEVHELERRTLLELDKYVRFAATLGVPAERVCSTGMEVPVEAEKIGSAEIMRFPKGLFFAGQILFDEDSTWRRMLHNETAFLIQRRFQNAGMPMVVLPVRLRLSEGPRLIAPSMTGPREAA